MKKNRLGGFAGKHMPPLNEAALQTLLEISKLSLAGFSEDDVREEYLAPIVRLLGYGRGKEHDVRRGEDFPLSPGFIMIGRQRIELDYQFLVYKQGFWLLEAKPAGKKSSRPSEEDIGQAFFYALHPSVDAAYFAVSNGWWFLLFDRDAETPTQPILEIEQGQLVARFDELRRLLSAEQVTFALKERLLTRIEQVLSADCYANRTDQFVESVNRIGDKVRPLVLENFRTACFGKNEDVLHSREDLLNGFTLDQLAEFPLGECWNYGEINQLSEIVLKKLTYTGQDADFYSKLCLELPRPVSVFHYFNAIYLVGRIADKDNPTVPWIPSNLRQSGVSELNAAQLFEWLIRLALTRFSKPHRPDLKMMWLVEGLAGRMTKRMSIYDTNRRHDLLQAVALDEYFQPEKEVARQNPHPAQKLVVVIELSKRALTGTFFRQHFDANSRTWNEVLAKQNYELLLAAEQRLIDATPDYEVLKASLGSDWSELMCTDYVNTKWYQLGAGVCDLSQHFPNLLNGLPDDLKEMYRHLAIARVNFAEKCCGSMNIKFEPCPIEEVEAYQREFFSV